MQQYCLLQLGYVPSASWVRSALNSVCSVLLVTCNIDLGVSSAAEFNCSVPRTLRPTRKKGGGEGGGGGGEGGLGGGEGYSELAQQLQVQLGGLNVSDSPLGTT